jgi:hypothetical protein
MGRLISRKRAPHVYTISQLIDIVNGFSYVGTNSILARMLHALSKIIDGPFQSLL